MAKYPCFYADESKDAKNTNARQRTSSCAPPGVRAFCFRFWRTIPFIPTPAQLRV